MQLDKTLPWCNNTNCITKENENCYSQANLTCCMGYNTNQTKALRLDLPRYRYQCITKTSIQTTGVTLDKMATPITIPNLTSPTLGSTKRTTNSYGRMVRTFRFYNFL